MALRFRHMRTRHYLTSERKRGASRIFPLEFWASGLFLCWVKMARVLEKHHILEAIEELRRKKYRPDAVKIVSYVSKKYGFSKNGTEKYLEALAKDGTLLKVEVKAGISYRIAANYHKGVSNTIKHVKSHDTKVSGVVNNVTVHSWAQLILRNPKFITTGITENELYEHLRSNYKTFNKNFFRKILETEVKNGKLRKLMNGNYCWGKSEHCFPNVPLGSAMSISKSDVKSKSCGNTKKYSLMSRHISNRKLVKSESEKGLKSSKTHSCKNLIHSKSKSLLSQSKEFRKDKSEMVEGKQTNKKNKTKRAILEQSIRSNFRKTKGKETNFITKKKLTGQCKKKETKESEIPEDNIIETKGLEFSTEQDKMGRNAEEEKSKVKVENDNFCRICLYIIDNKSNRASERCLTCQICKNKTHISCLEDSKLWTGCQLSKWQCDDCKSCAVCKESGLSRTQELIFCSLCDNKYHLDCANISQRKTTQKWFCVKCSAARSSTTNTIKEEFGSVPMLPVKTDSDLGGKKACTVPRKENQEIDETIPDCSSWSCDEVYSYFLKYVMPQEAKVFLDQEIDGPAVLFLTRHDVLRNFNIKLGPALKIYTQVRRLQERKKEPYYFWP